MAPLVTMVPPVPQILQPASLPNLPVIHHQQQPQVIYLQPVQPTELIVVSKKKNDPHGQPMHFNKTLRFW